MNKHYLISILVFLLAFTGCMGEDWGDSGGPDIPEHGFILNYSVESVATRATEAAIEQENTINSMFILFFEPSAQGTGKFIDIYIVPLEESVINGEFSSISIDFTDDKYTALQTSDEYNMLVAANTEDYSRAADFSGDSDDLDLLRDYFNQVLAGRTENQVIESTYLRLDGGIAFDPGRLPMSGKASKGLEDKYVDVQLTRSVCRIDVINKDPQYELISASLWNVFPRTTIFGGRFQAYEDEPPLNKYLFTRATGENEIKSRLYVYENYVAMPEQNDAQTTCVIVGLKKNGPEKKTEYYRINVSSGDLGQQLKRNNLYKININSVLGNGKSTEEDAYKDSELHISSDVNGWNIDESGIILFDGDNILALPYSQVNFTPAGGVFNCNIFTHGTGILSITNELLPEGMSVELNGSILTITAGMSDDDLQGMVEVSFGNLVATLTIKQQGDKTEYLEIYPDKVADFPPTPEIVSGKSQTVSDKIEVDASGEWDAILVCNDPDAFSFNKEASPLKTELSSQDTDGGFFIYLQKSNSNDTPKYGFVMITLRSNPKISRVILLTQETSGGIKLSRQAITFNPFGFNIDDESSRSYTIDVKSKTGVPMAWDIKSMSSGYNVFLEEPVKDGASDPNTLTITCKGDNTASTDQQAVFRIFPADNEANFTELTVTQEHHTLQFSPSGNFGIVAATGGRTQRVIVTSSSNWEATVTGNGNDGVYFYKEMGSDKPTTIEGVSGDEFSIVFPPAKSVTPSTATVTISIKGSQVNRSLIFTQKAMEAKALHFVGFGETGNITYTNSSNAYDQVVRQIGTNMRNPALFGPGGTVPFPGYTFTNQGSTNRAIPEDADIYQTAYTAVTATQAEDIKKWLTKSDKHIYFFTVTIGNNVSTSIMRLTNAGVLPQGYGVGTTLLTTGVERFLNKDTKVRSTKLYDYLIKDGPFTKETTAINPDEIELRTYHHNNSFLSEWPDTFIPILMAQVYVQKAECCFGIDPVNRFIFLGDPYVFGNYGTTSVNYSGSTQAPHNMKLLNNIIAWMTNAALYGDEFIDEFR